MQKKIVISVLFLSWATKKNENNRALPYSFTVLLPAYKVHWWALEQNFELLDVHVASDSDFCQMKFFRCNKFRREKLRPTALLAYENFTVRNLRFIEFSPQGTYAVWIIRCTKIST